MVRFQSLCVHPHHHTPTKHYTCRLNVKQSLKSKFRTTIAHVLVIFHGVVVYITYTWVMYILFYILLLRMYNTQKTFGRVTAKHIPNHFLCIFHSIDFFLAVGRYMYFKSRATPNWRHNRRGATQTKNTFSHQIIIIIILYAARMPCGTHISMLRVWCDESNFSLSWAWKCTSYTEWRKGARNFKAFNRWVSCVITSHPFLYNARFFFFFVTGCHRVCAH